MSDIKKVVLLAAGYGTRFLPATKAIPKEMLPLVDKPVIQYLVEEAVDAGIKEIIFVTSKNKPAIKDHFDRGKELESFLEERGKEHTAQMMMHISSLASFSYVRQKEQLGTAHAVLEAVPFVGGDPFAVMSGDDIIEPSVLSGLVKVYSKYKAPVVCLMRVPKKEAFRYGVIDGREISPGVWKIRRAVEKPKIGEEPSNLAIVVKYILTPDFLPFLAHVKAINSEFHIPPAIDAYIRNGHNFYGYEAKGKWYDCGSKLGYMKGVVHFGLTHPEIGKEFKRYLQSISL